VSLRRIIVLDCGTSRVAVGVFAEGKEDLRCESLTVETMPQVASESWPAAAAAVTKKMLGATALRGRAILILPSHAVTYKHMRTPRVSPAKSRQVLEFAVGQSMPHAAGELLWDACSASVQGEEIDHLVIAVKTQTVAPLFRVIQDARLELAGVLPSILALRVAGPMTLPKPRRRRMVIEAEARTATFLQIDEARLAVRSLSLAESGDWVLRLAQEGTRTLLHFNRQNQFESPEQVIVASDESWDSESVSRLSEQLKLPVEQLDFGGLVSIPSHGMAAGGMSYARLLGGAAIALGRAEPTGNLVPEAMREQERLRRRMPWLVAAALVSVTVLLPPIFVLRRDAALRQQENAELQQALAPLLARSKRMQGLQTQIAALRKEGEWLQTLAERRVGWMEFLAGLQARFATVEDVWLERLQTVAPDGEVPMKLVIGGYILDRGTPPVAERMKTLVRELRTIPAVAAVEGERFDASRPHLLRFELVLVISASHPL
jgi:Tfp pilus assembly protein PilN